MLVGFYAAMMLLRLARAVFETPETKGVPLEEIEAALGIQREARA